MPKNKTEDDFIINNYFNAASNGIWLAIYDISENNDENNLNYYTNQTLMYTNWGDSEPGYKNEYCAAYYKPFINGKWVDISCDSENYVLCEITEYASSTASTTTNMIMTM